MIDLEKNQSFITEEIGNTAELLINVCSNFIGSSGKLLNFISLLIMNIIYLMKLDILDII